MKINPFIIESAIASEVKIEEKNISYRVISDSSEILSHKIENEWFLITANGDSMKQEGIHGGNLLLFSSSNIAKNLSKNKIIVIRMSNNVNYNAKKLKLRIYEGKDTNGKIIVSKYIDGKKKLSKGKHSQDSIMGIMQENIPDNASNKFLNKYLETLPVSITNNDGTYCAKFNDIEYFLKQIEEFKPLSQKNKQKVNSYIMDTILEYGDNKKCAETNFNLRFKQGLSLFEYLKSTKKDIDKLSIIYFRFLELANNQIKFS